MTKIDNGGPAFPNPALADENFCAPYDMSGMTLRDWFAGQAQSIPDDVPLTKFECLVGRAYTAEFGTIEHWRFVADAEAAWKLLHADAMVAARGRHDD